MNEVVTALSAVFGFGATPFAVLILTFLRVSAAIALLPGIGETSIPAQIRLGLAIMISLAIFPRVEELTTSPNVSDAFVAEILAGLFIGAMLRLLVLGLSMAGTIAANATSLAQLFSVGEDHQPALSRFLFLAGLTIAFKLGLLTQTVGFLLFSYEVLPLGSLPDPAQLLAAISTEGGQAIALALQLAMPFLIASLLYNLALGVINRAMPQLMVTFIGAPALSLGGLLLLAITAPLMLSTWHHAFASYLGNPLANLGTR